MLRKKVCLLGSPGVGKTSLARRFIESMFSDEYISTIGVKVDRKVLSIEGRDITLIIWDIHGEHGSLTVMPEYLKGSAAYLVVVDASRPDETVEVANAILERSGQTIGSVPFVLVLNKSDLVDEWESVDAVGSPLMSQAASVVRTSAKTGSNVETAFEQVARASMT